MIDLKVTEAKGNFFDRITVTAAEDRARLRNLSKLGAFIRQSAISSMLGHTVKRFSAKSKVKNRTGSARPGEPPLPHSGEIVKLLFFIFDRTSKSVVVGPVKLSKPSGRALEVLEFGGDEILTIRKRQVKAHYAGNPFMRPAMEREISKAPALWANSIRG